MKSMGYKAIAYRNASMLINTRLETDVLSPELRNKTGQNDADLHLGTMRIPRVLQYSKWWTVRITK